MQVYLPEKSGFVYVRCCRWLTCLNLDETPYCGSVVNYSPLSLRLAI